MLESRIARAAAKLWYTKMIYVQQSVPVPRDSPVIVSGADDPDRVLLLGNGPTHGWGTVTHELAMTGQLARALTRRTTRPTDIRYIGDEMMPMAAVQAYIGDTSLAPFDLVLVVLSMNDAVRLTPADEYRADMIRLLDRLASETKPSARVIIAGIQEVDSLPEYRGIAARIGQRRADLLNAITRELVGRYDGFQFFEHSAPQAEPGRPYGSPALYAEWSDAFASISAPALDEARALDPYRFEHELTEHQWQWKPGEKVMATADHEALDRLAQEAKQHFGADAAWISLMDGDRQFFVANTAPQGRSGPAETSICQYTVQGDEPLIIENTFRDERTKDSPMNDVGQLRFYAGAPIKNEAGENIGTFCVLNVMPKSKGSMDEQDLQEWASRAQGEILKLAATTEQPADRAADQDATV
ncbi:GAF domain-containing protein [Amnibacterium kyonggiense]|uniref:GAF domain-containing protein n=1 Tax=Amnibacterium kyonggiense TaxID=595671 RepID=A0A4R7FL49_9MICO|nr:GAF domain-containing protein [Amnibacterium kyonggiense]TDS77105.1 GAF domain-containing protein [Amnibacterium kyonggiense]